MLMDCGTPEPPAAPLLPVSLAMVNPAMKATSVAFERMRIHEMLVVTATMLEMIPTRPFLGNLCLIFPYYTWSVLRPNGRALARA